jgi:hypothetical protein
MLLLFALLTITTAYWQPCPCPKNVAVIPGADVLAGGFDSTQLATTTDRRFKSPVFSYTYKNKQCMQSSLGGACYLTPDQLHPYDMDISMSEAVNGLFYSYYEYTDTYATSYTSSFGLKTPYFGASINYHQSIFDSKYYLSTSDINQGFGYYNQYLYTMTMPPAYVLSFDPVFNSSLAMLPSTIQSQADDDKYNEFLVSYGGYYVTSVIEGGRFYLNQYCNVYLEDHYSESWEVDQMDIKFQSTMFNMETGHYSNSSEYQNSEVYLENSNIEMYCFGGNLSLPCASQDWMLSIVDNPSYLNITFAPLYTLIYDDQDKYDTLKNKTDYYASTGILN